MLQAAAQLASRLAAASPAAAAALADSPLVGSLAALLEAPSTEVSPDSKLDALGFFRRAASRPAVRDAVSAASGIVTGSELLLCMIARCLQIDRQPLQSLCRWSCARLGPRGSLYRWMKRVLPPLWCPPCEARRRLETGRLLARRLGHWS